MSITSHSKDLHTTISVLLTSMNSSGCLLKSVILKAWEPMQLNLLWITLTTLSLILNFQSKVLNDLNLALPNLTQTLMSRM